jgi:hypothetical protein
MKKNNIENINTIVKDYIKKNNMFVDIGDDSGSWLSSGVNGISSFGKPNSTAKIKRVKHEDSLTYPGELMYEATYTFDNLGRRNTTLIEGDKSKIGIFFGDVICFGEGLNDNKTFPYYFQYFNPEYICYNYGFPGHGFGQMLLQIESDEFKKQFSNKEGNVIFLYRDDAIKNSCGKVSWNENFPKYKIIDGKLIHEGFFTKEERGEDSYLPSEFTNKDYDLCLNLLLECKRKLKEVSSKLKLSVVIVPLSFSHFKIHSLLIDNHIDVVNLFYTDYESYLGDASKFLDGGHTKFTNKFLNQRLKFYKDNNIKTQPFIKTSKFSNLDEVFKRVSLHSFFMPPMNDFPLDDAGVHISMVLDQYTGNENIDEDILIDLSEKVFYKKKKALELLKENKLDDIRIILSDIDSSIYKIFKQEYIDFQEIYDEKEYIIDE